MVEQSYAYVSSLCGGLLGWSSARFLPRWIITLLACTAIAICSILFVMLQLSTGYEALGYAVLLILMALPATVTALLVGGILTWRSKRNQRRN
ncbi:MAG: hypothetical protein ABJN42_29825 [Roseibium sp.]|uniref:hypothetical protein n=1 Tax=Roseibium sp. TaxID=1936156 RepID=UPI003297DAB1